MKLLTITHRQVHMTWMAFQDYRVNGQAELDSCWTAEGIWTKNYTKTSHSWATNWLASKVVILEVKVTVNILENALAWWWLTGWRFTHWRPCTVWVKKVAPLKLLCAVFSFLVNLCNENCCVMKIAQTYSYVYTNFGPFIWLFVWNV